MSSTSSTQPRRQRRAAYEAHTFERRRRMSVALSRELRGRFHRRSIPIRKGDTVRILSGSYVGREERVAKVDRRSYAVTLDNVTGKTGEKKLKPLPIRLSHLLVTRLNLADPWRRRVLKVSEPEEGEVPEEGPTPSKAESVAEPQPAEAKPPAVEAAKPKAAP